jgi:hypothetical protein
MYRREKQTNNFLISDSNKRKPIPSKTGSLEKIDYEYVRHGTCNFFVMVEPIDIEESNKLLEKVIFHYTHKHASWLNMAEIEIGIFDRQCLYRSLKDRETVESEVTAWLDRRNADGGFINWTFTRDKADQRSGRHYVS